MEPTLVVKADTLRRQCAYLRLLSSIQNSLVEVLEDRLRGFLYES